MAATRTFPRSFDGIGTALVKHFHNQVTMQTHRWMTVYPFCFCGFCPNCHRLTPCSSCGLHPSFQTFAFPRKTVSYNCLQKRPCSRSYTDGEINKNGGDSRRLSENCSQSPWPSITNFGPFANW